MLAAHLANWMDVDPLWLIVIAPPSNAKTEIMRALEGRREFYFLSKWTPATLVSGFKSVKGKPASLLPKLTGKTVVSKDFTTVLSMRQEQQSEILAQLREVYDGHLAQAYGNGVEFDWKGKIGFLAACTNVYDKHYAVIGAMGDRFLLYRSKQEEAEMTAAQAMQNVGSEDKIRSEIKGAMDKFLNQFKDTDGACKLKDETIKEQMVHLACFCAVARCAVDRDRYSGTINYDPAPEGPARIVKQLTQIGMGLAMVHGKKTIDLEIYEIIKKIGRDLVTANRIAILQHLWDRRVFENNGKWLRTKEIAAAVDKPANTTKRILEDLMVVGILRRDRESEADTAAYVWQIKESAFHHMARGEVFESSLLNQQHT